MIASLTQDRGGHSSLAGIPDADLVSRIQRAADLLPTQRPITSFVTQNPLHAFEHQHFEEGLINGSRLFGCQPYLPEDEYREKLYSGRIEERDLEAVLRSDLGESCDDRYLSATRLSLRMAMLKAPVHLVPFHELRWVVSESDALRTFRQEVPSQIRTHLLAETRRWIMRDLRPHAATPQDLPLQIRQSLNGLLTTIATPEVETWAEEQWEAAVLGVLWKGCLTGIQSLRLTKTNPPRPLRHRDALHELTGVDSDRLVHEVLIPFCAAYSDQGFASIPLVSREAGFFESFQNLHRTSHSISSRWMNEVRDELDHLKSQHKSPVDSIQESLRVLGVEEHETDAFLARTFASLRGWTGMIWQAESVKDLAVRRLPTGSLVGLLAVRLILERAALNFLIREHLRTPCPLSRLREFAVESRSTATEEQVEPRAFQVFQLAQLLGWLPEDLILMGQDDWRRLLHELESFTGVDRRRVLHLAYERRYRHRTLDALAVRASLPVAPRVRPQFQTVSCMDDREESFRRNLEELCPSIETYGMAGFFGVVMRYRGAGDAHFSSIGPIVLTPNHTVTEEVIESFEDDHRRRSLHRKALGTASRQMQVGSRTVTSGALLTTLLGPLATIPLVARVLAPRLAARIRGKAARLVAPPAATRLKLFRPSTCDHPDHGSGYSIEEAAQVAGNSLRLISLTSHFARLVFVLGHGSSSVNNPHKAAYDCGACAGSAGGPNARALAQMLNNVPVRKLLADEGIEIPEDTVFIGGCHNTCTESVDLFDLDDVPESHRIDLKEARDLFEEVGDRSAHERCRRFTTARLDLSFSEARKHVQARSEDLAQPRPELGHATNALLVVGRRERTRGLFLDRRAFLISYDPEQDDDQTSTLAKILGPAVPVSLGINLEYTFSRLDNRGWGCGTKLPHNVTSLLGVMDGALSDLRMGLPWQNVEIHEPMRLLTVVETTPERMQALISKYPNFQKHLGNEWMQLALLDPHSDRIWTYSRGKFSEYVPESDDFCSVESSLDWYRGSRDHLGHALISNALKPVQPTPTNQQPLQGLKLRTGVRS